MRASRILIATLLLSLPTGPAVAEERLEAKAPAPKPAMHAILRAVAQLLPLQLNAAHFAEQQDFVSARLDELADGADMVTDHAATRDQSFGFLAKTLTDDVAFAHTAYAAERFEESRAALNRLTGTCSACHSRLPSGQADGLAAQLLAEAPTGKLSLADRARLEVSTRQFDTALGTYEALLRDPKVTALSTDVEGHLTDYLALAMRVRADIERPKAQLAVFAARADTPNYLKNYVAGWGDELAAVGLVGFDGEGIDQARTFVKLGRQARTGPISRAGVVYDLAASGILYRMIDAAHGPSAELAEAYYLLALTDSWTRKVVWLAESRFYLETAIRMAPHASFASDAFRLWEEYTLFGYSGSGGLHLPDDEARKSAELRRLTQS